MGRYFFIYGTLKAGYHERANQFDNQRTDVKEAWIDDADLYDLGFFPAMVHGTGRVFGELHEYDDWEYVLEAYDRIEGFHEESPETSMYIREVVDVHVGEQVVKAYTYFWNDKLSNLTEDSQIRLLGDGVWLRKGN